MSATSRLRQIGRRVVDFALASILVCCLSVDAGEQSRELSRRITVNIPPQKVSTALLELSRQAGIQILMPGLLGDQRSTRGAQGQMTVEEALSRLLEGTALRFRLVGENAIGIESTESSTSSLPNAAGVGAANGQRDSADFTLAQATQSGSSRPDTGGGSSASTDNRVASALEEIIVTAERRAEKAQDVPISMSVFSADFIKQYISDPYAVANLTPNYQIEAIAGLLSGSAATMRGLGSSDRGDALAATSILTYYDGIAAGTPFVATLPQWDLDRIEVLRGPQGTLYGRNAVAGAVQYLSAAPTDEFDGYGEFTTGEFNLRRFEGAVSGPITDTVKARVSALTYDRGGDVTDTFLDVEQGEREWWGVKGIVDWQVDNFEARLKAQHFEGDVDGIEHNAAPSSLLSANVREWLNAAGANPDLARDSDFEKNQSGLQDPFSRIDFDLFELDLNYDFGPVMLTAIGGYLDGDNFQNNQPLTYPAPITDLVASTDIRQWSAEFRLTSQTELPLQWIAGAYYQRTEDSFDLDIDLTALLRDLDGDGRTRQSADSPEDLLDGILPVIPVSTVAIGGGNEQELETYALFLHTTHDWTDRLTTTHAVRYTREEKDMDFRFTSLMEFPVSAGVVPGSLAQHGDFIRFVSLDPGQRRRTALSIISDPNTVDGDGNVVPLAVGVSSDEFTWRFAADFRIADSAMIYSSISKGFRGAIFSIFTDPTGAISAAPETSIVYETGAKTQWWNNRLQVNVSAFYDDHTDFQTNLVVITPSGSVFNQLANIPESELYGGEIEVQAVPFANLFVVANLGILETEITKVTSGNEAILGNELPFAEDLNFSGLVRYDFPTALGTFSPQLSWRYRGEYWSRKENDDITGRVGDFWTVDWRVGYESPSSKLYGLFYLKNILDEVQPVRLAEPRADLGSTNASINERRNWGITVGYRF